MAASTEASMLWLVLPLLACENPPGEGVDSGGGGTRDDSDVTDTDTDVVDTDTDVVDTDTDTDVIDTDVTDTDTDVMDTDTAPQVGRYHVSGATGDDANPGTASAPFATVAKGCQQAAADGVSDVWIAGGTYPELVFSCSARLHGSYDASWSTRDIVSTPTVIDSTLLSDAALTLEGTQDGLLEDLRIVSGDGDGLVVQDGTFRLERVEVESLLAGVVLRRAEAVLVDATINSTATSAVVTSDSSTLTLTTSTLQTTATAPGSAALAATDTTLTLSDSSLIGGYRGMSLGSSPATVTGTTITGAVWGLSTDAPLDLRTSVVTGTDGTGLTGQSGARGVSSSAEATIDRCRIEAGGGGAMTIALDVSGTLELTNSALVAGTATGWSWGTYVRDSGSATLVHNAIVASDGGQYSGAVGARSLATLTLVNNLLEAGTGASNGSEIQLFTDDITTTLASNLFAGAPGCTVYGEGSGWCLDASSTDTCTAWGNTCTASTGGVFAAAAWQIRSPDWTLSAGSAAVDQGTDSSAWISDGRLDTDLSGGTRPLGVAPDLGPRELGN